MYTTKEACERVGIQCLRKCGMSIKDMKIYMNYCIDGASTIPKRKEMLEKSRESLLIKINELNDCMEFIDNKQSFYDGVMEGTIEYISNLIDVEKV